MSGLQSQDVSLRYLGAVKADLFQVFRPVLRDAHDSCDVVRGLFLQCHDLLLDEGIAL